METKGIKIEKDRLIAAVEDNMFGLGSTGFCLSCGDDQGGCEPDARKYPCESCGKRAVYGAEEVLLIQGEI